MSQIANSVPDQASAPSVTQVTPYNPMGNAYRQLAVQQPTVNYVPKMENFVSFRKQVLSRKIYSVEMPFNFLVITHVKSITVNIVATPPVQLVYNVYHSTI